MLGGLLPYIFIMFCFIGCLYPSLDMITGEKEKGTLETLLTVPVSRFHILLGKMMAIAVVGVCAAFMTIGGMYVTLRFLNEIPQEIMSAISDILSARFILMLFAMLIPLSFFFAGMLSAIVIRANSFKEAQSYVSPLMFVVLVPAMIALMPGMKLSWDTVWIPILNIALATKEIIAGTIHMSHYIAIVISLVGFALLALAISIRQFSKEKNILK
jgi:sodium transport system permease protein